MDKIDTVMFGGAAFRGIYYFGVIKALQNLNIVPNIKHIYGSSAGSYACLILLLGYNYDECIEQTQKFHPKYYYNIYAESLLNFDSNYAFDDGLKLLGIVKEIFLMKNINPYITFKELYEINPISFHVNVGIVNNKTSKIYNHINTPDFIVANAIYASMCIPFFFKPLIIDGNMHIDGSFINDFPMEYTKPIDPQYSNVLCFKSINTKQENNLKSIFKKKIDSNFNTNLNEYINLIFGTLMKNNFINEIYDENIIKIDFHEIKLFEYEYDLEKIHIVNDKSYNQSIEQIKNAIKKLDEKKIKEKDKYKKYVDNSTQTD